MDRLIEIKQEMGLKDDFHIRYLNEKLNFLLEEYYTLYNSISPEINEYVMLLKKTIKQTKDQLNQVKV